MSTQLKIRCGKCGNRHSSVEEVRSCYYPRQTPPAAVEQKSTVQVSRPTQKQLNYIRDLGGDVTLAMKYTMKGASLYIDRLKREQKKGSGSMQNAPNRQKTKIPLEMLHAIPDGYYASRPDSTHPFTFFRFSRPKSGQFKDALKIQTQHGPELKLALVIYPGDRLYWSNMSVEDDLLLAAVDPSGCAIAYSEEIGRCMRCNTELTDERSRWYGIGPECEKKVPHMIDLLNERKGEYRPGWEQR